VDEGSNPGTDVADTTTYNEVVYSITIVAVNGTKRTFKKEDEGTD
jgi:hypothetical protein